MHIQSILVLSHCTLYIACTFYTALLTISLQCNVDMFEWSLTTIVITLLPQTKTHRSENIVSCYFVESCYAAVAYLGGGARTPLAGPP